MPCWSNMAYYDDAIYIRVLHFNCSAALHAVSIFFVCFRTIFGSFLCRIGFDESFTSCWERSKNRMLNDIMGVMISKLLLRFQRGKALQLPTTAPTPNTKHERCQSEGCSWPRVA